GFDNDVALVHALDGAGENLFATCHEFVEQHFALCVTNFLQDYLLGSHRTDTPDWQRLDLLFNELTDLNTWNAVFRIHQHFFSLGVLQTGIIRHHHPAAEGVVIAAAAINRTANIRFAFVQLFGSLRQSHLNGAKHHIAFYVLFARNGLNQHQQFAVHAMTLLISILS